MRNGSLAPIACLNVMSTVSPETGPSHIVLLSAPVETLVERLSTRTTNSYGKSPDELRRFLEDVETVEPLLRRVADQEVRTTVPLDEVVATVLRLVDA